MNFGIKFTTDDKMVLIDMETAEILAEGGAECRKQFEAYDGNYTLTLVE